MQNQNPVIKNYILSSEYFVLKVEDKVSEGSEVRKVSKVVLKK